MVQLHVYLSSRRTYGTNYVPPISYVTNRCLTMKKSATTMVPTHGDWGEPGDG